MDPIINPMFFYWLNAVDNARSMSLVISIIALIFFCVLIIFYVFYIYDEDISGISKKTFKVMIITLASLSFLFGIALIFTPSKDTLIEMAIAQNLTTNNIESGIEAVKGVTDYIIEAIKGL